MTGTLVENGPSNPYRVTDREVLDLSWRMGKTIERVAVDTWTEKITVPPFWKDVISNEAENVRSQLSKLTQKTIWDNNVTVSEYQKLTLPPQIPFLAEDRHLPSEKPLRVLFKTIDHFFDANLLREFAKLSSEFPGSEKIDKRIKQLTESALIIERVISERFPLKFADYKIWPDVRIKNTLQFDAILTANGSDQVSRTEEDLLSLFRKQVYAPIELKVDFRSQHITGYNNGLDRRLEPRFIREIQTKFAKLLIATDGQVHLPPVVYMIFLRGLRPHVVHPVRIDKYFLDEWMQDVVHNLRSHNYPETDTIDMLKLSLILEKIAKNSQFFQNGFSNIEETRLNDSKLTQDQFPWNEYYGK